MMSGTEIFDYETFLYKAMIWGKTREEDEPIIYKKELRNKLLDFNKKPALNQNFFSPRLISEKAKQVLEPFNFGLKGKKFEEVQFQ
jgi:hypothetical protein